MKKYFILFGIFSIVGLFIFISCNKENPTLSVTEKRVQDNLKTKKILAFKEKLNLKVDGSMTTDSAIWYIEGLINYEKALNNHIFETTQFNSDSIVLTEQNGEISMEQINAAYNQFTQFLEDLAEQQNNPDFTYDLIDVSVINNESLILKLTSVGGEEGGSYLNYTPFDTTDYWYWGWDLGKCGGQSGGTGEDAADKLEYKFNHPNSLGQGGYFTDVEFVSVFGFDFPDDPNNPGPYCDNIIFYYISQNPITNEPCLSPDELNFYLSKFDYIKDSVKPVGKIFKNVEVWDDVLLIPYDNRIHYYDIYFGVLVANPH